jgi:electron transfer flavoprotein-quinone oxidoreductase
MKSYDAIVVGAGPAGVTAALRMAQSGLRVLVFERADMPGAKNMFGGMLPCCPVLERLIPGFWEQAPWERHVVKRILTLATETSATSLAFESRNFDQPPYNGYTLLRPAFDRWYAEKACAAGVSLIPGCRVDDLTMNGKRATGVRVGKDQVRAPVVLLCDGVLSLLASRAGIRTPPKASAVALGVKGLFHLPEQEINDRFQLVRRQGATQEFMGCTEGIRGGGFIYTQTETLSVGVVFHLDSLKQQGSAVHEMFQRFLAADALRKILRGARLLEYSAHLLPESRAGTLPPPFGDGVLLAGDAAGLCYTNGINQEGMNLAITSGFHAAETAVQAHQTGDFTSRQLAQYESRLKNSFVLKDMKTFDPAINLMQMDRLFTVYPRLIGSIMEQVYRSDGKPKKSFGRIGWSAALESLTVRQLIFDLIRGGRSLL